MYSSPSRWSISCWKMTAVKPRTVSRTDHLGCRVRAYSTMISCERRTSSRRSGTERQPSGPYARESDDHMSLMLG